MLVSVALLPLSRKFAKKISKPAPEISNVDRMLNQTALVTKEIDPDEGGQIRYQGEVWRAVAEERIETNAKVIIVSITGTSAEVKRLES